jgi:hypothetical protein
MKYIKIRNKGELDIRLLSLMGASTKRGRDGKIGKFGTGLKYAISYLMKENVYFRLFVGEKEIVFGLKPIEVREETFHVITVDGESSSLTTNMGLDWKAWMILRELYCNAKDEEEGSIDETYDAPLGEDGYTTFFIQETSDFADVRKNWTKYFLNPDEAIQDEKNFAIHPSTGTLKIYKQGVLVHEADQESVFSYDLKNCDINELREYTGYTAYDLAHVIAELSPKNIETFIQLVGDNMYEGDINYRWQAVKFGKNWETTIGEAKIIAKKDFKNLESKGLVEDNGKLVVLPDKIADVLCYSLPHVSALRLSDNVNSFYEVYDQELENKIKEAISVLEKCNYMIIPEAKFLVGVFGDPRCLGKVNMDTKEIMLSLEHKQKPFFELLTTIVEEYEHLRTGFSDETRAFQQHFINLYTYNLVKNEIIL